MESQSLLPSFSATPSSYNFGPRRATDKMCGYVFVAVILGFFVFTGIGISTAKNSANSANNSSSIMDPPDCNVDLLGASKVGNSTRTTFKGLAAPISASVVLSFLLGAATLYGFKTAPKPMVWTVIVIKILAPAVVGVLFISGALGPDQEMIGGLLIGLSVLLFLLYWCCWRTQINLVAQLFKVSAVSLQDNWLLIPLKAVVALFTLAIQGGMIALLFFYLFEHGEWDNHDCNEGKAAEYKYPLEGGALYAYVTFAVFALGWYSFWALETRTYIVADVTGHWYWHGKGDGAISRATRHGFTTHFGSMAFAGLVMWFVEMLKEAVRRSNENQRGVVALLCCLLKMLAMCILSYLEFLCKMSVVLVGITGRPFVESGKEVVSLFTETFGDLALSTGVWVFPARIINAYAFIVALMIGGATGVVTNSIAKKNHGIAEGDASTYAYAVGTAAFIIAFNLLIFFGSVLLKIVDTVFMCFMIDKRKGIVTKPEIHAVLGTIICRKYPTYTATSVQTAAPKAGPGGAYAAPPVQQQPVYPTLPQQGGYQAPPPAYPTMDRKY